MTVVYPDLAPVIFTVITLPRCDFVIVHVDFVAPVIRAPLAYHWYRNVAPVVHVPGFAVSLFPTAGVPEIVGVPASITRVVARDVTAAVEYPVFFPVTVTVIRSPRSEDGTVNVDAVAPAMGRPSAFHR